MKASACDLPAVDGRARALRWHVAVRGLVQGVGFRPFVYRLASSLKVGGFVFNTSQGVEIEIEAPAERLSLFVQRLREEAPPPARIDSLQSYALAAVKGATRFDILPSTAEEGLSGFIVPDLATCEDCLGEMFDPAQRRYRYAFTSCTRCGPRYSLLESPPYDRARTTLRAFALCRPCREEYENPLDRRFHHQSQSCPDCGPGLQLWDAGGRSLASGDEALLKTERLLGDGACLAVKGVSGFHLMVEARQEAVLRKLREKKARPLKPFALLYPHIEAVRRHCQVSAQEEALLRSEAAPLVLLPWKHFRAPFEQVSPESPYAGVMLPGNPLHHLLMRELDRPLVATSGNLKDEPLCCDEREALAGLGGTADFFLVHNLPVRRPLDDSIVRIAAGEPLCLRRARGYAPLPLPLSFSASRTLLALGGQAKSTVTLALRSNLYISPHGGDLETPRALEQFKKNRDDLLRWHEAIPQMLVCDAHPDYESSRQADGEMRPLRRVQHHCAHVAACMAEHRLQGPLLGVAWDGSGLGADQSVWGGEFFWVERGGFNRVAHLRPFLLLGGEKAVIEPRRVALSLLFELGEEALPVSDAFGWSEREIRLLQSLWRQKIHAVSTSSVGRLFDGVSALLGLALYNVFEAYAAVKLEWSCLEEDGEESYAFGLHAAAAGPWIIDWEPVLRDLLRDKQARVPAGIMARKFHHALAELVVEIARRLGAACVVLSGGCFQNRYLLERSVLRLRQQGFDPYWPRHIPPHDGGLSVGQAYAVCLEEMFSHVSGHPREN